MDDSVELLGSLSRLDLIEDFPVLSFRAGATLSSDQVTAFHDLAPRDQFTEAQRQASQITRQNTLVFAKLADGDTPALRKIWWRKDFVLRLELWANLNYANGAVTRYGVVVNRDISIVDVRLQDAGPFQYEQVTVTYEDAYTPSDPNLSFRFYRGRAHSA
jgi:hypothetical protein